MNNYNIGDYVKIIAENEWNDMIGVINKINDKVIAIFCVKYPYWFYYIDKNNVNDIVRIDIYE